MNAGERIKQCREGETEFRSKNANLATFDHLLLWTKLPTLGMARISDSNLTPKHTSNDILAVLHSLTKHQTHRSSMGLVRLPLRFIEQQWLCEPLCRQDHGLRTADSGRALHWFDRPDTSEIVYPCQKFLYRSFLPVKSITLRIPGRSVSRVVFIR